MVLNCSAEFCSLGLDLREPIAKSRQIETTFWKRFA
jgi:hypothetical protein